MKTATQPNTQTHCPCGAAFPIHPTGYCGAAGYAIVTDGSKICYACADKAQIGELKTRQPFVAYVSSDGQSITTWTGGKLMTVTRSTPCALTRQSFTHDHRSYKSIRARDVHGKNWYGRGSAGICITLRPCA